MANFTQAKRKQELVFFFDWQDISNTRVGVSSAIQTPRISLKILRCASYFQLSFRYVFGYPDEKEALHDLRKTFFVCIHELSVTDLLLGS